jgi:hypothetical protein
MRGHCCICGAKKPAKNEVAIRAGFLMVKADNDPQHVFCAKCQADQSGAMQHCIEFRKGSRGCRINDDPNITEWRGHPTKPLPGSVTHAITSAISAE